LHFPEGDKKRDTHPSVATLVLLGVPLAVPSRSFSFCSSASARRFRKSDSATRPIVCVLSRSSAVLLCDVKRELGVDDPPGVDLPDGGFDAMAYGWGM
jgi:hypothetical protein